MALVRQADFESGSTVSSYFDTVGDTGANLSVDATTFKNGSHSLAYANNAVVRRADHNISAGHQTCSSRFWYNISAFLAGTQPFVQFRTAGGKNGGVRASATGGVSVLADATNSTVGLPTLLLNTWYLIDWKADLSSTTWTVTAQITDSSGTVVGSGSASATGEVATDITSVRYGISNAIAGGGNYDDIYTDDSSANYPIGWNFSTGGVLTTGAFFF
jgi:hypothetical protein